VKHSGFPVEAIPEREPAEGLGMRDGRRDGLCLYKEVVLAVVRKLLRL
jgi:hypothetical protein